MIPVLLLASAATAQPARQIVITSIEPVPSNTIENRQVWACPSGLRIEISTTLRPRPRPGRRSARIIVNGHIARGVFAGQMASDLSQPGVFRISVRCTQGRQTADVIVSKGRREADGKVTYWDSRAAFTAHGVTGYRAMEASNEDGFWYT